MLTKRKIRHWEAAVRQRAYHDARALAVAIAAGTAWAPLPYDLGIVLEPGEVVLHRCPASYRWRGTETWTVQRTSFWGRQVAVRQINAPQTSCLGMTDWLVTNIRLATRMWDGRVASIYWMAVGGLTVDLAAELVVFDGADRYHGELFGPAIAPIAVAAIAFRFGVDALLDHPALAILRSRVPAA